MSLCPAVAVSQICVNEIYYDHPGADAGHEFIELFNAGTLPVPLSGYALEFHNGSGEGWELLWTAAAGDSAPPGRPFVIGGELVQPAPDAVTGWSLQNGPDAIRLVYLGNTVDLVGYGDLDDPGYVETASAPDAASGQSLARMPDGRDTDHNALDFVPAQPSPGGLNLPDFNVALHPGEKTPVLAALEPGQSERLSFLVINLGARAVAANAVEVQLWDSTAAGRRMIDLAFAPGLPAGAEAAMDFTARLEEGFHFLSGRAEYPADERPGDNTCRLIRRIGSPAAIISEIMSDPPGDCPQYIELYNAGPKPVNLADYHLRDRSGGFSLVTADSISLSPRDYLVITSDSSVLKRWFPGLAPGAVIEIAGSWPYFNRSGSGGFADSVIVADSFRIPVSRVDYPPQPSDHRGRSLERVDLFAGNGRPVWVVNRLPSRGTPGRPYEASLFQAPAPSSISATPNPFSPFTGEKMLIAVDPGPNIFRVNAWIYDISGRCIRALGSAEVFPCVFVWDGWTDYGQRVTPGLYLVAGECFAADGGRVEVKKVVVGCGRKTN